MFQIRSFPGQQKLVQIPALKKVNGKENSAGLDRNNSGTITINWDLHTPAVHKPAAVAPADLSATFPSLDHVPLELLELWLAVQLQLLPSVPVDPGIDTSPIKSRMVWTPLHTIHYKIGVGTRGMHRKLSVQVLGTSSWLVFHLWDVYTHYFLSLRVLSPEKTCNFCISTVLLN